MKQLDFLKYQLKQAMKSPDERDIAFIGDIPRNDLGDDEYSKRRREHREIRDKIYLRVSELNNQVYKEHYPRFTVTDKFAITLMIFIAIFGISHQLFPTSFSSFFWEGYKRMGITLFIILPTLLLVSSVDATRTTARMTYRLRALIRKDEEIARLYEELEEEEDIQDIIVRKNKEGKYEVELNVETLLTTKDRKSLERNKQVVAEMREKEEREKEDAVVTIGQLPSEKYDIYQGVTTVKKLRDPRNRMKKLDEEDFKQGKRVLEEGEYLKVEGGHPRTKLRYRYYGEDYGEYLSDRQRGVRPNILNEERKSGMLGGILYLREVDREKLERGEELRYGKEKQG